MLDRLALVKSFEHLLHFERTVAATAVDRDLPSPLVAVDVDAVGRLAHVAALETRHRPAEPIDVRAGSGRAGLRGGASLTRRILGAGTEAHPFFRDLMIDRARAQRLAHRDALFARVHAVSDVPGQLGGVEIAVPVVDDRRGRTVVELEVG